LPGGEEISPMLLAANTIASSDGPVEIVLGTGVLLAFTGVLARAVRSRVRGRLAPATLGSAPRDMTTRPARRDDDRIDAAGTGSGSGPQADHPPAKPARGASSANSRATPDSGSQPSTDRAAGCQAGCVRRAGDPAVDEAGNEGPQVGRDTVAPLGRLLERSRRLHDAEEGVARELSRLPLGPWVTERYVLLDGYRIPFVVAGATGVFVICASDGAWTMHDLDVLSGLAGEVRKRLPGYEGTVHAAVCLAFDELEPRSWFGGEDQQGRGGWVLGIDWLQTWIVAFGPAHGLRGDDVYRLHELAGPIWGRRSVARLPLVRNLG
jgi:hypothetical protein